MNLSRNSAIIYLMESDLACVKDDAILTWEPKNEVEPLLINLNNVKLLLIAHATV